MTTAQGKAADPLRERLEACREPLGWAFGFSAFVNILYLAPSLYMMQVYDRVLVSGSIPTLIFLSLALVLALSALSSLDGLRAALLTRASLRLEHVLAAPLLDVALHRRSGGRQQIMREFDFLRQTLRGPVAIALMDAPWTPVYVLVCFILHPLLGLLAFLGGGALLAVAILNERALRKNLALGEIQGLRLYAAQEADQQAAEAARALGMRRVLIERQLQDRAQLSDLQTQGAFIAIRHTSVIKFLRIGLQSAALGLGAYLAIERQISVGAVIAASILLSRALAPLEQIVGSWWQIGQARLIYDNLKNALADAPPAATRTALPKPAGALSLERVSLRIEGTDSVALRDISFALKPGEIIGVIGPSGAGKSALCRVASGAINPDLGVVRLDGASLNDWNRDDLGRHIGYLPQDIGLLAGAIAENICRFESDASRELDDKVVEAAKAAGAHQMILRLPAAYETMLGPGGSGLSFGQAQRIALARALFRNPALLVLDEPNAHLDADGEAGLIRALVAAKARGAAVLIAAHRIGLLNIADRVVVLQEGRIEALGPRDEVAKRYAASGAAPPEGALTPAGTS